MELITLRAGFHKEKSGLFLEGIKTEVSCFGHRLLGRIWPVIERMFGTDLCYDSAALGPEQDYPFNRVTELGFKVYLNNEYSAQQLFCMTRAPSSQNVSFLVSCLPFPLPTPQDHIAGL